MKYEKHRHGRVPLFGKVEDDFINRPEMVPGPPVCTVTERILNLIKVHGMGMIDDKVYTQKLRALQDEFLAPVQP